MNRIIAIVFLLVSSQAYGQRLNEWLGFRYLDKANYLKAGYQFRKMIAKDSLNPVPWYGLARFYLAPGNPAAQLDSAHRMLQRTRRLFHVQPTKIQARLQRIPLDSLTLQRNQQTIDSLAYLRAVALNTEAGYLYFLKTFRTSPQQRDIIQRRNAVAFTEALRTNTVEGFQHFMDKYPDALEFSKAQQQFNQLLFERETANGRLSGYRKFLKLHPETPYRDRIEAEIFQLAILSGHPNTFEFFIREFPSSRFSKEATNILYHQLREENLSLPAGLRADSLNSIPPVIPLSPFLKGGLFGFMNDDGAPVLEPFLTTIPDDYLCGGITEDLLIGDDKVWSRSGAVVYRGKVSELDDLGYGFILVGTDSCRKLVHKSGHIPVPGCIQQAQVGSGRMLLVQQQNTWQAFSLTGRKIMLPAADSLAAFGAGLILRIGATNAMIPFNECERQAEVEPIRIFETYDSISRWSRDLLWVKRGPDQCLLNENLAPVVPWSNHQLTLQGEIFVSTRYAQKQLYTRTGKPSPAFDEVKIHAPWIMVRLGTVWHLWNLQNQQLASKPFDSLYISGKFITGTRPDSTTIFIRPGTALSFPASTRLEALPGPDSISYVLAATGEKKSVYTQQGKLLFTGNYERLQPAGGGYFIFHKKEKKGLIDSRGKVILAPEYDAIGIFTGQTFSLLKNMRFGLFQPTGSKLIKPAFARNVVVVNEEVLAGTTDGSVYSFLNWQSKPIPGPGFRQILPWNDSSVLVQTTSDWRIFNFKLNKTTVDGIQKFDILIDGPEKCLRVSRNGNEGILHAKKGWILPPTYSRITNLGTAEKPLYFTEKHVEEAGLHIVIYYKADGSLIRKEVYESEEYDKIYCDD